MFKPFLASSLATLLTLSPCLQAGAQSSEQGPGFTSYQAVALRQNRFLLPELVLPHIVLKPGKELLPEISFLSGSMTGPMIMQYASIPGKSAGLITQHQLSYGNSLNMLQTSVFPGFDADDLFYWAAIIGLFAVCGAAGYWLGDMAKPAKSNDISFGLIGGAIGLGVPLAMFGLVALFGSGGGGGYDSEDQESFSVNPNQTGLRFSSTGLDGQLGIF